VWKKIEEKEAGGEIKIKRLIAIIEGTI